MSGLRLRLSVLAGGALLLAACATTPAPEAVPATPVAVPAVPPPTAPAIAFAARLVQGALVTGQVAPGSRLQVGGRRVRVAADGTFVFGLDRDAPPTLALQVERPDGVALALSYPVAQREYRVQRVTGIAERIMNPSPADEKRIAADAALAAAARERDDERRDFLQPFIWPTTGPITGVYGSQRFYNGVPKRPHYGVDVGVPTGTPVVAPAGGIVTLAHPDMFYSGGTLIIDHGHGVSSTMMHLSAVLVQVGQRVEQGQLVARTGASGRASGPHLDWRMNWFGERIDPQLLVPPMPGQ